MKRFSFFNEISNWFVPFYLQHPDIAQQVKEIDGNLFMEALMERGPFCDSDKYSFLIAFQRVVGSLPEDLRNVMRKGEAPLGEPFPPALNLSSIRLFFNESALRIRWPKCWSFSFNISPTSEHPGLISFRMEWLDLLAVQGTLKSLLQHHSSKASIL